MVWFICRKRTFLAEKNSTMQQNTRLAQIDFQRIPQKKIREFIHWQIDNNVTSPELLTATYYPGEVTDSYRFHEKVYNFKLPLDRLWKHYLSANPGISWTGNMISFGLMISKKEQTVTYVGDPYAGAAVGQVMFIQIDVLGGLVKVPVAHEIISIDAGNKYLEVSYLKGGKSAGMQRISFFPNQDQTTRIVHTTYYRSASPFRDKFLYPIFHSLVIDQYHENMIRTLEA